MRFYFVFVRLFAVIGIYAHTKIAYECAAIFLLPRLFYTFCFPPQLLLWLLFPIIHLIIIESSGTSVSFQYPVWPQLDPQLTTKALSEGVNPSVVKIREHRNEFEQQVRAMFFCEFVNNCKLFCFTGLPLSGGYEFM